MNSETYYATLDKPIYIKKIECCSNTLEFKIYVDRFSEDIDSISIIRMFNSELNIIRKYIVNSVDIENRIITATLILEKEYNDTGR